MAKDKFFKILSAEVMNYKQFLETDDNEWIIKGFIDVDKNVYSLSSCDTKVVSKIIEILLIPKLNTFAENNGLVMDLPSKQNYYPDLTFRDDESNLFAVDFKTSYYDDNGKVNGLTLGSYWGYFRDRDTTKNMDRPYSSYCSHTVIGVLYKREMGNEVGTTVYTADNLKEVRSVIGDFVFFVQPKWKIASDSPGSGNTRNIGGVKDLDKLINGGGPFAKFGEDVFDDYWRGYLNRADAKALGIWLPPYTNLNTYKEHLFSRRLLLNKIKENGSDSAAD